ncbi:hypothetical protein AQUCO_01300009v1 [Aquilegia coerulea]|uniref:Uncharacterized protein n=1 Tax=Aquilegia coerulea TaxID=218851 RepID=A0A2G5DZ84_AQUCA|nr:hypothetical protein AQUCO_01300009v1 [Aquilegia coerulea]
MSSSESIIVDCMKVRSQRQASCKLMSGYRWRERCNVMLMIKWVLVKLPALGSDGLVSEYFSDFMRWPW